jgi:hypothetical protein
MGKPTKKMAEMVRERTAALARVQRDDLLDFMLDGFWSLPVLTSAQVKDAATRTYYHGDAGWTIPTESLGRKGAAVLADEKTARSAAESIRLWVIKNLHDVVPAASVAVVVEAADDELTVAVYRKAG